MAGRGKDTAAPEYGDAEGEDYLQAIEITAMFFGDIKLVRPIPWRSVTVVTPHPAAAIFSPARGDRLAEGLDDPVAGVMFMREGEGFDGGTALSDEKQPESPSPAERIDERIRELGDWRGEMLARIRALIHQAVPDVVEEWKWRGVPVWYGNGMICTGETYKKAVKMTFARGASLEDPAGLFNSSLEGNVRRAIDFHEETVIDEDGLVALIRSAVALNNSKMKRGKGS